MTDFNWDLGVFLHAPFPVSAVAWKQGRRRRRRLSPLPPPLPGRSPPDSGGDSSSSELFIHSNNARSFLFVGPKRFLVSSGSPSFLVVDEHISSMCASLIRSPGIWLPPSCRSHSPAGPVIRSPPPPFRCLNAAAAAAAATILPHHCRGAKIRIFQSAATRSGAVFLRC